MGTDFDIEVDNLINGLSTTQICVQLNTILASPLFARAKRMKSFLRYVVEETLQGRAGDLKEYNLALAVFHREETFDPSTNALVRIAAGRLRKMLVSYYLTDGRDDPIVVEVPVGSYAPRFRALKSRNIILDHFENTLVTGSAEHPTVPDKPSIAVLAFDNMSDDQGQEYFADGIADDIITGLSRYRSLFVIARNSSFSYKGKAVDVKQIAAEQGVRYVLEGCVYRQSCRVRVTARLINTNTGICIWADQYEGALEGVLLLQDQLSKLVVNAIEHEITCAEYERAQQQRPDGHTAWDLYLRGIWAGNRGLSGDQNIALEHLRSAVRADPNFSPAYSYLSWRLSWMTGTGICAHKDEVFREAIALGEKAIELDNGDAQAYFALGNVLTRTGRMDEGANLCRISIELNPNYAKGHYGLSYAMNWQGKHKLALEHADLERFR